MLSATAVAISAAARRETKKERADATGGNGTSTSIPDVPSTGRSGRVLQCCGKGYVWQLIVLDTGRNRLGKDGLDAMGEGLWMEQG